jgi:probable HAF family extracellular repeat protein
MTGFQDLDETIPADEPELVNCTIAQNTQEGIKGGMPTLRNTIVWNNGLDQLAPASATVSYSCIQGGYAGTGNIDADPLFVCLGYRQEGDPNDPNDNIWIPGDYHLRSQAGRYDPNSTDWVLDDVTSPCIDAGDPNNSVAAEPNPNGGRINMGAYGGTTQASKSTSTPAPYTIIDLGTLGGTSSSASAINAGGQVVGWANTSSGAKWAFLYSNGAMTDLGTLGGTDGEARAINTDGYIVGYTQITGNSARHAFLYDQGHMTDLGTLGGANSWAYGINNLDQVVGAADIAGGASHAFLYSSGTMTDLNSLIAPGSGWVITEAKGINDKGQIVGTGTINGQSHAFLMTLIPQSAEAAEQ